MSNRRIKELEMTLSTKQIEFALRIIERDMQPKDSRKTDLELMDDLQIGNTTFYKFKRDPEVQEYIKLVALRSLFSAIPQANQILLEKALNPKTMSPKYLEMLYKLVGAYVDRVEVDNVTEKSYEIDSIDSTTKEIEKLLGEDGES